MIQRRAPLKRNKPLNRRAYPIRRESQKARLKRIWRQMIRRQYFARWGVDGWGQCQSCGNLITEHTSDTHHKLKRGLGGKDEPENALVLCRKCHRPVIHGYPEAYQAARDSEANVTNGKTVAYPEHLRSLLPELKKGN